MSRVRLSFRGFIVLLASIMALNALAIDAMLPAFPAIGRGLHVADPSSLAWIITAYMAGFGIAQLIHGTLSDRVGRRPVLLGGLIFYAVFSFMAAAAPSFWMLIVVRFLQGMAAAALRVVAISVVRDCYAGRKMARVMSLIFIVFLAVPIIAPALGTLVLLFAPWRWIFVSLGVAACLIGMMTYRHLPETLAPEDRRAIDPRAILTTWRIVLRDRYSLGYTAALTLMSGAVFGFINSIQPITAQTFGMPNALAATFAAIGTAMAVGSLLNSRYVERLGMRFISFWGLAGFLVCAVSHLVLAASGYETLPIFIGLQIATMLCFSLCGPNFGSLAMDRLGHVAGAAASLQGFASSFGGALCGYFIGACFDGTTVPMAAGFTLFGFISLLLVLITENGDRRRLVNAP